MRETPDQARRHTPSGTALIVAELLDPELLLEIEAIALAGAAIET